MSIEVSGHRLPSKQMPIDRTGIKACVMDTIETRTVTLPEEQAAFIDAQVSSGAYGSTSAVVCAALRLLAQTQVQATSAEIDRARRLIQEGAADLDPPGFTFRYFVVLRFIIVYEPMAAGGIRAVRFLHGMRQLTAALSRDPGADP